MNSNGEQTRANETNYSSWKFLGLGAAIILLTISILLFLLYGNFNNLPIFQVALIMVLTSYFPLSYLSYLQSRSKSHKKRIKDDNQLLGLTTESELENIYGQIYNPQQFIIYISLVILATLLGFGLFYGRIAQNLGFVAVGEAKIMFYSFLGAYIFSVYYVYRRYVTFDLQPSIYLYITARMVTVQAIALVATQILQTDTNLAKALIPIVAFIIGYIPDTGIRWLTALTSRYLGKWLKRTEQRLSNVDGISLWHETRLRESGIDNVQNLAAADVRELILNSRFSTQQLMHWIDQAILMTNLPVKYQQLRDHGICTISALRRVLERTEPDKLSLPDATENENITVTPADLWAVYYATDTGPNLHYVIQYWDAIRQLRTVVVQQNLENLLQEQQTQTTTGEILDEVLTEQLEQMMDKFKLDPDDLEKLFQNAPEKLISLGLVYIKRKQYAEAISILTKAISLDQQNVAAYRSRGSAWSMLDEVDRAFADFQQAKELNPQDAVTLNSEGSTYLRQGEFDRAITAYEQAITLNPEFSSAYYNLGTVYNILGEYDKAIGKFDQAIRYAPESYNAYIERGSIYLKLKAYDEAIEDFKQAIHYDRNNSMGYHSRAVAYMQARDFKQAIYNLDMAIDIDPYQAIPYLNRGKAHQKLNALTEAIADFTEAIRLDSNLAPAYKARARAYEDAGRLLEAIADIDRYLDYNPIDLAKAEEYKQKLLQQQASKWVEPARS